MLKQCAMINNVCTTMFSKDEYFFTELEILQTIKENLAILGLLSNEVHSLFNILFHLFYFIAYFFSKFPI